MDSLREPSAADLAPSVSLEDDLAALLAEAADEVSRAECFDEEQRAEVYTILNTLQADAEIHRGIVHLLHQRIGRYVRDV